MENEQGIQESGPYCIHAKLSKKHGMDAVLQGVEDAVFNLGCVSAAMTLI